MNYLFYFFIFFLGLSFGSFLNVLIYRLPRNLSIARGRSFCPSCKKSLSWRELIPLFSFIFLRGKCLKCKAKISLQYPTVEFVTGILFVISYLRFTLYDLRFMIQEMILLIFLWLIIAILIAVFFIDLKHYIIPDRLILTGGAITLFYLLAVQYVFPNLRFMMHDSRIANYIAKIFPYTKFVIHNSLFLNHLIFAIIGGAFFGFIVLITRGKGMGLGDVKLAVFMGLVLGENLLLALYLTFIVGALAGIILMLFKKKKMNSEIPFGPFLAASTLLFILL